MKDFFQNNKYYCVGTFSQVAFNLDVVKDYLNVELMFEYDNQLIELIMEASASYILDYTQLSAEELDNHNQASVIFLMICSELYNNRQIALSTGTAGIVNRLLSDMLIGLKNDWL